VETATFIDVQIGEVPTDFKGRVEREQDVGSQGFDHNDLIDCIDLFPLAMEDNSPSLFPRKLC
jgi:hypothetical protein